VPVRNALPQQAEGIVLQAFVNRRSNGNRAFRLIDPPAVHLMKRLQLPASTTSGEEAGVISSLQHKKHVMKSGCTMNQVAHALPGHCRKEYSAHPEILLISDDRDVRGTVEEAVDNCSYCINATQSQSDALGYLKSRQIACAIIDLDTSASECMNLVSYVKNAAPDAEVITMASSDKIRLANQSLRHGAALYLVKPFDVSDVKAVVCRVASGGNNNRERREFKQRVMSDLFGGCESMLRIMRVVEKVAPTASTILISGESGTGKEVLARIIHRLSGRDDERFIPVNCGAIPETLFESEMFGHRRGAFTGADRDKAGLVEHADRGTR